MELTSPDSKNDKTMGHARFSITERKQRPLVTVAALVLVVVAVVVVIGFVTVTTVLLVVADCNIV